MESVMKKLLNELKGQNGMDQTLDEFKRLPTDEERVKFAMNTFDGEDLVKNVQSSVKNSKVSVELRNQANQLYTSPKQSHHLDEVIKLYTKSVAYAPDASPEQSIAFANRSAALFKGRLYDECLKDIKRALDLDYPDSLKAKLFARKAQSLVVLGAPAQQVEEAVQEARKWLEKMDKNNQGRKMMETILNNPIKKSDFPEQRVLLDDERNLPAILADNPEVKGLSSAAVIKYSEKFGRHVIATRDIEPGEVIGIEKSYISILEKEKQYTNCTNCLKRTWSGIPCKFCPEVIYCSEKCCEEAWEDHHDMECQLLNSKTDDFSIMEVLKHIFTSVRLCVRALKEAGSIENLRKAIKKIDSSKVTETDGFAINVHGGKDFTNVYLLSTNSDKRDIISLWRMTNIYLYFIQMFSNKNINLFGKQLKGNLQLLAQDPSVTFIGGLITRYIQIVSTNSYGIAESFGHEFQNRGFGIFPYLSYFNHSCDPNCYKSSLFGRTMILRANSFIKKGEQIFVSYGSDFAFTKKAQRQERLMVYFFNCECHACTNNWPIMAKLPLLKDLKLPNKIKAQALRNIELCQKYMKVLTCDNSLSHSNKMIYDLGEMMKYFSKNVPVLFQEFIWVRLTLEYIYNRQGNCLQTLNPSE